MKEMILILVIAVHVFEWVAACSRYKKWTLKNRKYWRNYEETWMRYDMMVCTATSFLFWVFIWFVVLERQIENWFSSDWWRRESRV